MFTCLHTAHKPHLLIYILSYPLSCHFGTVESLLWRQDDPQWQWCLFSDPWLPAPDIEAHCLYGGGFGRWASPEKPPIQCKGMSFSDDCELDPSGLGFVPSGAIGGPWESDGTREQGFLWERASWLWASSHALSVVAAYYLLFVTVLWMFSKVKKMVCQWGKAEN